MLLSLVPYWITPGAGVRHEAFFRTECLLAGMSAGSRRDAMTRKRGLIQTISNQSPVRTLRWWRCTVGRWNRRSRRDFDGGDTACEASVGVL